MTPYLKALNCHPKGVNTQYELQRGRKEARSVNLGNQQMEGQTIESDDGSLPNNMEDKLKECVKFKSLHLTSKILGETAP